jgi:hypothetical protein
MFHQMIMTPRFIHTLTALKPLQLQRATFDVLALDVHFQQMSLLSLIGTFITLIPIDLICIRMLQQVSLQIRVLFGLVVTLFTFVPLDLLRNCVFAGYMAVQVAEHFCFVTAAGTFVPFNIFRGRVL